MYLGYTVNNMGYVRVKEKKRRVERAVASFIDLKAIRGNSSGSKQTIYTGKKRGQKESRFI